MFLVRIYVRGMNIRVRVSTGFFGIDIQTFVDKITKENRLDTNVDGICLCIKHIHIMTTTRITYIHIYVYIT
jgi:hypothetical protein